MHDVDNHNIKTTNPVNVQHAGVNDMTPFHITTVDLPILGNKNITGHTLPQLQLASIDNDCTAYFNKNHIYIIKNYTIICQDSRDTTNALSKILVPTKTITSTFE